MKNETTASSNEMTKANSAAEMTPGAISGSVTWRKARSGPAPQDSAARSRFGIETIERGEHGEDDERQREDRMRHGKAEQRAGQAQLLEDEEHRDRQRDVRHDHRADHQQLDQAASRQPAAHQRQRQHGADDRGADRRDDARFDAEQRGADPVRVGESIRHTSAARSRSGGKRR